MTQNAPALRPDQQPVPGAIEKNGSMKGGALAAMVPENIEDTFRLAKALSAAGDMVPKHFQGNPESCMAAILRGMEVGLAPMQALASIAVINGRASLWGDALPALMQRAGHHVDVEITGEWPDAVATATLTRGDTGKVIVRTFSGADAKRAGLSGKQGPWQQYPKRMLAHRARAWAIRDGAADTLMGLQVGDEMSDLTPGPDGARDVNPRRSRMSAAPLGPVDDTSEAEPEIDEIHDGEIVEDGDDDPMTPEQRAELERVEAEIAAKGNGQPEDGA